MNYLRTELYEDVAGNRVEAEWRLAKKYEITPRPAPGWKVLCYSNGGALQWYFNPLKDDRIKLLWDDMSSPDFEAFEDLTSAISLNTWGSYQQVVFMAERGAAMVNLSLVTDVPKVFSAAKDSCWLVRSEHFCELRLERDYDGQVRLCDCWPNDRVNYLACSPDPYHYLEVARRFARWFNAKRFLIALTLVMTTDVHLPLPLAFTPES